MSLLNYVIAFVREVVPAGEPANATTAVANSTASQPGVVSVNSTTNITQALNATSSEEDVPFEPSLVNTLVYLLVLAMQASTVAVCYKGHPFMQGLFHNKKLLFMWVAPLLYGPSSSLTTLCRVGGMVAISLVGALQVCSDRSIDGFPLCIVHELIFSLIAAFPGHIRDV